MLLRYLAIAILVLIALRLIGRLFRALSSGLEERSAAPTRRPARDATSRRLEPCAHCGTYFDPGRALTGQGEATQRFCSSACREAQALEGDGG